MAGPFLFTLPKSARTAFPTILSGVRRGLSSRNITTSLQRAGIRISRSRSVLPAMRAIRQLEAQGQNVRFVGQASRINTNRLPPAITQQRRRFSYRVRVNYVGPFGPDVRYLTIATDSPNWTRAMIEGRAREFATGRTASGGLTDVEVTLESGQQRAQFADFAQTSRGFELTI